MSASEKFCPLLYAANISKYDNGPVAKTLGKCKGIECMWYISTRDYPIPIEGISNCAIVRLALK